MAEGGEHQSLGDALSKKVFSTDSDSIRKRSKDVDESVNFEEDSNRDNYHLKKAFKDALKEKIPEVINVFGGVIIFGALAAAICISRYLYLIWSDEMKLEALLSSTLTTVGAYIFGTLTAAVFKNKL